MMDENFASQSGKKAKADKSTGIKMLQDLMEKNAKESIVVAQKGKIVFCNKKTVEIFGYSETEILEGNMLDFIHPDDRGDDRQAEQKPINGGATGCRLKVQDNQKRWQFFMGRDDIAADQLER